MKMMAVTIALALSACGGGSSDSEDAVSASEEMPSDAGYDEAKQLAWNEVGKEAIKIKLKDPDSAQFRNVKFYSSIAPVTCGEVNAKNSFGGYSGYERFIAGGDVITVLESEMAPGEMDQAWAQICT